jgi:hypothetical protein
LENTWAGCRARVDEYQSDVEEEDSDDNVADADSDTESEFEWEGTRTRNGLGIDDLVEEDLQRIISEFSKVFLPYNAYYIH